MLRNTLIFNLSPITEITEITRIPTVRLLGHWPVSGPVSEAPRPLNIHNAVYFQNAHTAVWGLNWPSKWFSAYSLFSPVASSY